MEEDTITIAMTQEDLSRPLETYRSGGMTDHNLGGWSPASLLELRTINSAYRAPINVYPLLKIIEEFAGYESNWDSYDAPPFDPIVIDRTKDLVTQLALNGVPEPNLIPAGSGAIILEWLTSKVHLEIHIDPEDDDLVYISEQDTTHKVEYIGPLDKINNGHRQTLARVLSRLIYCQ